MTHDHSSEHLTETELDNQVVRSTAEEVERYSKLASRIEVVLIALAALSFMIAAAFGGYSLSKLRDIVEDNRQRALDAQAGQEFAINAVNCIRFVLIEHRYVNQEYHDLLLEKLQLPKVSLAKHPELPKRPTAEQIAKACKDFENNPEPPPPPPPEGKGK